MEPSSGDDADWYRGGKLLLAPNPADADGARLAPLLRSSPLAPAQAGRAVPGRWQQKMLLGLLGSFAAAYAAVLELPARSYRIGDLPLLREDVGLLCRYFLDGGVLEANSTLTYLNLESNAISTKGVEASARASRPTARCASSSWPTSASPLARRSRRPSP